jgi:hypothetical protein
MNALNLVESISLCTQKTRNWELTVNNLETKQNTLTFGI